MKFSKLLFTLALVMLFFNSCQQDNDVKIYPDLQLQEKSIGKNEELEIFFGSDEFNDFKQFLHKLEMRADFGKGDVQLKNEFHEHSEILEKKLNELDLTTEDILEHYNGGNLDVVNGLFAFGDDRCCEDAADDFNWCKQAAVNQFGYFAIGTIVITIVAVIVAGLTGGSGLGYLPTVLTWAGYSNLTSGINLMSNLKNCDHRYLLDIVVCPCACENHPDC